MLDHNSIDLFTFTFFLLRPASVTWQRTYATLKVQNYFSDHLHWKHVPLPISFYVSNKADKLRRSVLHICSTSEIEIRDVSKNFPVPPFQQCKGMPADCFCNPNFCVIYMVNHLLFWPYTGFILHFIQPNPVVVDKYGSIASLLKIHSLCYSHVRHRSHVATECARAVYCFRKKKKKQHSKSNNPKTRDELSVE